MATAKQSKAFSIAKFLEAFEVSPARQYMSAMELAQINRAVEEKDIMLLGKLYDVLLEEQVSDENIVRDFVMTKNRLIDDFMIATKDIEKKFVEAPLKKKMARTEKREQKSADAILQEL